MSDRTLKVLMTGLLIFGLVLMMMWPQLLGHAPLHGTPREKQQYLVQYFLYITALLVTFFTTVVLAWVLVRRARRMVLEDAQENLRILMETTLRDHERKQESHES